MVDPYIVREYMNFMFFRTVWIEVNVHEPSNSFNTTQAVARESSAQALQRSELKSHSGLNFLGLSRYCVNSGKKTARIIPIRCYHCHHHHRVITTSLHGKV